MHLHMNSALICSKSLVGSKLGSLRVFHVVYTQLLRKG